MKTCNSCKWFVEENGKRDYSHEEAKKAKTGFCLIKDLFTFAEYTDKACSDYVSDKE